ncbi:SMI1/KNR4 family protein [Streptomyces sp. NPDC058576]|uniref:SMI1/KNR4 family protein n=1 Tax=Streptomyces sp. NPDC058576 TaxID=3346547 RepID=UPI003664A3CC
MTVDEAWQQIEDWLRTHAPSSHAALPPPAAADEIRAARDVLDRPLPQDLLASLARHNGSGGFVLPHFYRLDDTRLIGAESALRRRAERDRRRQAEEDSRIRPNVTPFPRPGEFLQWNPHWIPLAHDESGNLLFVSQEPGPSFGRIGEKAKDDNASFPDREPFASPAALLASVARGLHDGVVDLWGEREPYVDEDGFLDWREPDADTVVAWDMEAMNRRFGFG